MEDVILVLAVAVFPVTCGLFFMFRWWWKAIRSGKDV